MLCSQNSGKYLSREWHEKRQRAIENSANFTSAELTFLEIDTTTLPGPLGDLDAFDSNMNIRTSPVDPYDSKEDYDWRRNPAVGD
jgi:hypothetical protein